MPILYKLFVGMKLTDICANIFVYLFVVLNAGGFMKQKCLGNVKTFSWAPSSLTNA